MPLKPEEMRIIQDVADAFTFQNIKGIDRVKQANFAGDFVRIGNSVDPVLAQLMYAKMYSLAVDQDQMPDDLIADDCEAIQVGIRNLLELAKG